MRLYTMYCIGCPVGISVQCTANPCHKSACPSYTNAICEVDKCTSNSTCISKYYVGFNEVTNICSKLIAKAYCMLYLI